MEISIWIFVSWCISFALCYVNLSIGLLFTMIKKQQELAAVFKKIGDKQTCTIGLYELYRITKLYPQVNFTFACLIFLRFAREQK